MTDPACLFRVVKVGIANAFISALVAAGAAHARPDGSIGVWSAAPAFPNGPELGIQTIRQPLHLSRPEKRLSVRISNEAGTQFLSIGRVTVGLPGHRPDQIAPGSALALTFGGHGNVMLLPGQALWSDPVTLPLTQDIVLDLFVDRATGPTATHPMAHATGFISSDGDEAGQIDLGPHESVQSRFFVTMVKAYDPQAHGTIVALGDSITDGSHSTLDMNARWPDILAQRLAAGRLRIGVVNQGLAGNRLIHDVPMMNYGPSINRRFERDVLSVPGVTTVILIGGINDIGIPATSRLPEQNVSAQQMTDALASLVLRAHAHGIRVILGTLSPFKKATFPRYYTDAGEQKRMAVNDWIRHGRAADKVIDFDAVLRDPQDPHSMLPNYDCGDHLHPNDAGYRAMADAIDLQMLLQQNAERR